MSKQGYEPAPTAHLPSAPPPPYDATFTQPAFNPDMQASVSLPYHYQPAPVTQEHLLQGAQASYPPQAYYPQPAQPPRVTETTVVVGAPLLVGPKPLRTTCPNCRTDIQSRITVQHKGISHLFCLGLCLLGCCLCSCVPYCLESLKEVRHTCPKCKAYLGTYSRS